MTEPPARSSCAGPQSLLRELLHQQRNAHLSFRKQYEQREKREQNAGTKHGRKPEARVNVQSLHLPLRHTLGCASEHTSQGGCWGSLTFPRAWGSAPRITEWCPFPSRTQKPPPAPRSPASGACSLHTVDAPAETAHVTGQGPLSRPPLPLQDWALQVAASCS